MIDTILLSAVAAKFSLAAWVLHRYGRAAPLGSGYALKVVAGYVAWVAVAIVLVYFGLDFVRFFDPRVKTAGIISILYRPALLAIIYAPLNRLLIAPIALGNNRHG